LLASEIRQGLGESLYSVQRSSRPLPQVTTPSLQALELYSQGKELWQKRKFEDAIEVWKGAVKLDPNFAMAHASLGVSLASFVFSPSHREEAQQHLDRALALRDRIADRERLLIQAEYASALRHTDDALKYFATYLKIYPDDVTVQSNVGGILMRAGRCDEAGEHLRAAIQLQPTNTGALINLASCLALQGKYAEALAQYDRVFEIEPSFRTNSNLNHEYGTILVEAGQHQKAREVYSLNLAIADRRRIGLRSLALLDMCEGKFHDAAARLREAVTLESDPDSYLSRGRDLTYLAAALQGSGDLAGAKRALQDAIRSHLAKSPDAVIASDAGVLLVRLGDVSTAKGLLGTLRKGADLSDVEQSGALERLQGEIELARGRTDRAIAHFRQADQARRSHLTLGSLARAAEKAGDTEQAISLYETLLARPIWFGWESQPEWLEAHLELAHLYLTRGEKEKAGRVLDELLNRWKDGDPDLPLLREARQLRTGSKQAPR
jgi:tetratricopeptide (TPR) repeat protein